MEENRRDKEYLYNEVRFYLSDFIPDMEQSRYLMLKVLDQSMRDYISLYNSDSPNEQILWEEARDFIYNDDYRIMWGSLELSIEAFLDILDLEIDWVREQTTKKFKHKEN